MATAGLDSFLNGNVISASPAWSAIIQQPPLKLRRIPSDQPGAITLKSDQLFGLVFSSSQNASKFGPAAPSTNDAATPDLPPDAVFGLLVTAEATRVFRLGDVRSGLGLNAANTPLKVAAFWSRLDANGTLSMTLDTSEKARCALWALSGPVYRTAVSIVFVIPSTALDSIKVFIQDERGLTLRTSTQSPRMTIRMLTSYTISSAGAVQSDSAFEIVVHIETDTFDVELCMNDAGLELRLFDLQSVPASSTPLLNRLNTATAGSTTAPPASGSFPDSSGGGGLFNSFFKDIELWYMIPSVSEEWSLDDVTGSGMSVPGTKYWQIVLIGNWQSEIGAVVALQYDSRASTLYGRLLFASDASDAGANRRYDYEPRFDAGLATSKPLPPPLDLWRLFSPSVKAPSQIPHLLTNASVQFSKRDSANSFIFGLAGSVSASSGDALEGKKPDSAPDGFSWDRVKVQAVLQSEGGSLKTSIQLSSEMTFKSEDFSPPSKLYVDIAYRSSGSWLLHGQANDIPLGSLGGFFAPSVRTSAMRLLGGLTLWTLEMLYTYDSSGEATSFFISAALVLGELELDLSYEFASTRLPQSDNSAAQIAKTEGVNLSDKAELRPLATEASWKFEAVLGAASPSTDAGKILDSLVPKASSVLPPFVRNIPVGAASSGDAAVKLLLHGTSAATILAISITIGDISLTFVNFVAASSGSKKTILRISVDELAVARNVPVIKDLPQPFDSMLYLWLDDEETDLAKAGLFEQELHDVNEALADLDILPMLTKDTNKGNQALPALRTGHHFMLVNRSTVVLDHTFSNADATSTPSGNPDASDPSTPAGNVDPTPTKGALDKKFPLLSITALSLLYKRGALGISVDATVKLGPITFSLIGLSIGIVLSTLNLKDLGSVEPVVDIQGLEVLLDSPPITLSGVFVRHEGVTSTGQAVRSYRGGVALGFEAWKFLAVGEYAVLTLPNGRGELKSVFVYAKLNGPLLTLAFATVSGVRVGLGYNSVVRSPQLLELSTFPFLNDNVDGSSGQDPLKIINALTNSTGGNQAWVSPKEDSYWVAAGLTLRAMGILAVTAVLMFGIRESGFVISVFANGVAQIPSEVKAEATLFYVEVNMLAELNTVDGYFAVQAALAPTSHALISSCRLTGGFALVNWFAPSPNAGDFVFTYHRAYTPPPWYPVPPRLGISFTLGGMINVTGNVYFAVTPKCIMGGGALHMGLDIGPVSAWLDAAFDVFIQFNPFHYAADISVSVGCAISIKVWFVRVRISASVGAALHIEGPDPFGGSAHVDFYLFGFTIDFGKRAGPAPGVSLPAFYQMLNTPGPAPAVQTSPADATDPMMARLKFTLTGGLLPQPLAPSQSAASGGPFPDTGASKPWVVKAGTFAFTLESEFAISAAEILQGEDETVTPVLLTMPNGSADTPAFYSKPMHVSQPISSRLQISVYLICEDDTRRRLPGFNGFLLLKKVPTALWGSYSEAEDPSRTKNPGALTNPSRPTIELCMGVTVKPPEPRLVESNVQHFDPAIAFKEQIGSYALAPTGSTQSSFLESPSVYAEQPASTRWSRFTNDWKTSNRNAKHVLGQVEPNGKQADGLLKMASHWLGWNSPPPGQHRVQTGEGAPSVLDGAFPSKLLDTFGEEYSSLPRLSTSVV
ncbi:MAG: hypothetical protein Q9208_008382 [Pyrenodesmia sp. 3 TL-2023]